MNLRRYWWWALGAALILGAVGAALVDSDSQIADVFLAFSMLWVLASSWLVGWWVWRWMTYRVGVRLFVTYLLVGVLPVLFAAAFAVVGLYILMGQYTSVRFGSELRRVRWELSHQCDTILQRAEREGPEAARALLEELAASSHEPLPRVAWQARFGEQTVGLHGGEDLPDTGWIEGEVRDLTARLGDQAYGVVSTGNTAENRVTALIPLDGESARAISGAWWFDVAFLLESNDETEGEAAEQGDATHASLAGDGSIRFSFAGEEMTEENMWPAWSKDETGLLARPLVVWFRVAVDVVDLETGAKHTDSHLLALLRTSPTNVWRDFTLSRYELGKELWGVLAGLGALFLLGYGLALAAAFAVVLSIARSTSRLTQGARAVEKGDFDHRVPVKRKDQLGDLAESFNHMTSSVQSMLADVSEKERLARELELAREIQQSLLPGRRLELGQLAVRATFQPATEVGGDYFDVFSVADDRLIVTVGDVAGHGLSTGLLMASLKSSVAALVHEGYSSCDLIEKVNRLLLEHGQARTMVTMAVIDIDPVRAVVKVANAGHPPPYLISAADGPVELAVNALPMGTRLCRPASREWEFPVQSRLVLYSDGLVEAMSVEGEPYGYDRLRALLARRSGLDGDRLTQSILDDLAEYTSGRALADDLTVLVVERT